MSANLRRYVRSLYTLDAVVRRVPDDAWDAASPCDEWNARQVLGHVMWGLDAIAAGASGEAPPGERDEADVAGERPLEHWSAALDRVLTALDQQGVLQTKAQTPFGEMPIDDMLGFFFGDPLMHTWDIAVAVGVEHGIPDELAEHSMVMLGAAGDALRGPGRLGAEVEAPPGTDAATRMAAFGGRAVS